MKHYVTETLMIPPKLLVQLQHTQIQTTDEDF